MTKETTICHLLPHSFWTTRKCHNCQQLFTSDDYLVQNYQLTFTEFLKTNQYSLTATFQLSHKSCCSDCTNYLHWKNKKWLKKENSIN